MKMLSPIWPACNMASLPVIKCTQPCTFERLVSDSKYMTRYWDLEILADASHAFISAPHCPQYQRLEREYHLAPSAVSTWSLKEMWIKYIERCRIGSLSSRLNNLKSESLWEMGPLFFRVERSNHVHERLECIFSGRKRFLLKLIGE
jgi:hypothetical protein